VTARTGTPPRRPPRRARRDPNWNRRVLVSLVLTLATVALAAVGARAAWRHEITSVKLPAGAPPVRLIVPPGSSADSIGRDLQVMGLTRHAVVFRALVRSRGVGGQLKAGDYALRGPLSLEEILDKLVRGDIERRGLTVPEGRTATEIAAIAKEHGLDPSAFLAASRDPSPVRDLDPLAKDLEGYLFPDTYEVPQAGGPEPEKALVRRMIQRFREVVGPQLTRVPRELSVREVVTLASIVEMETGKPEERPKIAAVFLNRLRKGMPLQTDPTVIYALKTAGRWDGNIRRKDLELDSPYNTYRYPGLPPGPIACPGREAILAVLEPAASKALYFVSRNDGTHQFSETLEEHNRAVNQYQKKRART
jgi:UPF0755 protein